MSRFFSPKYRELKPYVPGEQPAGGPVIKLNTNEMPFPPRRIVWDRVREEATRLNLYSDPDCAALREKLAETMKVSPDNLIITNGSDEVLNFAFMAFCDARTPAVFPDVTYGFYPVFARIDQVPFREIPLKEDWTVDPKDYEGAGGTIFLANPNAPTGLALSRREIAQILEKNPDHVVVIDEAYVDFGGESCISLIDRYPNLLVTRTFSKSRAMAGMRLGFGVANPELIRDLKTVQYSTNPYNVDRLAQAAGIACLEDDGWNQANVRLIRDVRDQTAQRLKVLGFGMTESRTNFLFVRHPAFPGPSLRDALRKKNILIRWFDQERIRDWNRISIGSLPQMNALVQAVTELLEEKA